MKHKLKLTTKQVKKLYAIMGEVAASDDDMRDVRRCLSNILGNLEMTQGVDTKGQYQVKFKIDLSLVVI